jgi:UDP-glucose:(heptosyl)LPS alpha-1,3-glucosyltransferase
MKFAFCLFKYYPYGGLERDFIRIIEACQQHGHEIEVFTMQWTGNVPKNIHLNIVPTKGRANHKRCASFVKNLAFLLKSKQYSAIVGFNRMPGLDIYYAADVCYACDAKERHGWLYRLTSRYKTYSAFEFAVFAPQSNTQIMYLAPMVKQQYIDYYQTPESRFHQISPGIASDRIVPANADQVRAAIRSKHKVDSATKVLLQIGSDYQRKGVDRSLFAIASLPEKLRKRVVFWVVGKGNKLRYKRLAAVLHILPQIKFLGTSDNIPEFLLAADLLMHPARREAAGMVLIEAIVTGLPALTTATCGFAYHIERAKAGLIVPEPFAQTNLNHALKMMLSNANQLRKWHENALIYGGKENLYTREDAVAIIEEVAVKNSKLRSPKY